MTNKEKKLRFTLRLPEWLDEKITREAKHKGFTKNAYILQLLQEKEKKLQGGKPWN